MGCGCDDEKGSTDKTTEAKSFVDGILGTLKSNPTILQGLAAGVIQGIGSNRGIGDLVSQLGISIQLDGNAPRISLIKTPKQFNPAEEFIRHLQRENDDLKHDKEQDIQNEERKKVLGAILTQEFKEGVLSKENQTKEDLR